MKTLREILETRKELRIIDNKVEGNWGELLKQYPKDTRFYFQREIEFPWRELTYLAYEMPTQASLILPRDLDQPVPEKAEGIRICMPENVYCFYFKSCPPPLSAAF